jgi:hypothetical protein
MIPKIKLTMKIDKRLMITISPGPGVKCISVKTREVRRMAIAGGDEGGHTSQEQSAIDDFFSEGADCQQEQ